jgi:hypothetical protein
MKNNENKNNNMGRKFTYITEYNEEHMGKLKNIPCKYHIIQIKNEKINGFIYFDNAKSLPSAKKTLNVVFINITDMNNDTVVEIYKNGDYWEKGQIPKQGRKKKGNELTKNEMQITNQLLNETIMNLLKESIDLRTENKQLGNNQNDLLNVFIESNKLLQEEIKELKQANAITISNSVVNNIENKTFNINVFLNEECKNAISLTDFIKTIQIQESDLFYAKNNGLVEAITNVFQRELQNYELNKRPVHCTDIKRETLHIKENDGWVKENANDGNRLKRAISYISDKKIEKLKEYVDEHPEMKDVKSSVYEDGLKLMVGIMGGTEHPTVTQKKVQKNIAKAVFLTKSV